MIKIEHESSVDQICFREVCFHEVSKKVDCTEKSEEGDIDTFITKDAKPIHHNEEKYPKMA